MADSSNRKPLAPTPNTRKAGGVVGYRNAWHWTRPAGVWVGLPTSTNGKFAPIRWK